MVAALVAISSVLVYQLLTLIYRLPVAASAQAADIDVMFRAHFIIIAFLFSLISVFVLYSVFVFRRRDGDEGEGVHFHGNAALEIVWTVVPLIVVIAFGVWGAIVLSDITEAQADEMVVTVTGRQWSWAFEYPDYPDVGAVSELVLPVNQPVVLEMNSLDVLHSFWVPEFRVKQDLVPGQATYLRITPTEEGTYKVRCAEICGFGHHSMLADVRVLGQNEFDAWVSERTVSLDALEPAERGEIWYAEFGCIGCHTVDGRNLVGPTWQGLFGHEVVLSDGSVVVADEAYLRQSILEPGAKVVQGFAPNIMPPNYESQFAAKATELADQGIEVDILADLIAFIQSLEQ
jgi:cytochrome c oxidase subunit II